MSRINLFQGDPTNGIFYDFIYSIIIGLCFYSKKACNYRLLLTIDSLEKYDAAAKQSVTNFLTAADGQRFFEKRWEHTSLTRHWVNVSCLLGLGRLPVNTRHSSQWWYNVGPPSATLAQQCTTIG